MGLVTYLQWMAFFLLSFLCGVSILGYLVASPLEMGRCIAVGLVSLFLFLVLALRVLNRSELPWVILLFLCSCVAGYLAANSVFLSQEEKRTLPAVARPAGGTADGHMAIVYFTHGEPQVYSPLPWLETFHELDADGTPFIPKPFRPLFFYNLRHEYLELGGSFHNKVHRRMLSSLEYAMPAARQRGVRFYLAFLDSDPRPDEVSIQAVNEGASQIVLTAVFLTESSHTQAGREMVEALGLDEYGVSVCATEPLWDSSSLRGMFVERVERYRGDTARGAVGVLLVGHGQPPEWDEIYPTQTEQENQFRDAIKELLIERGYNPDKIVFAWMEFKEPRIPGAVKELVAQGVDKLMIIPASISADSIHSDIQIPRAVAKAGVPNNVQVVNLGAWGDDPLVIQAIKEKVEKCAPILGE